MRKFLVKILAIGMFFATAFHANAQFAKSLTFNVSNLKFDTINEFIQPYLDMCHFNADTGAPNMPYFTKQYVLPKGAENLSITINNSSLQLISDSILVYPTQPPSLFDGSPLRDFLEPDSLL